MSAFSGVRLLLLSIFHCTWLNDAQANTYSVWKTYLDTEMDIRITRISVPAPEIGYRLIAEGSLGHSML